MANVKLRITGMTCGHCLAKVEKALKGVSGVYWAVVDLPDGEAEVDFDDEAQLVGAPHLMRRLDEAVYLGEKPLGEFVELRLSHLIGCHIHERVVATLGARRNRDAAERAVIRATARRFFRRREPSAEKRLGRVEHARGTRSRAMEVPHQEPPPHAGLNRRNDRLLSTTERLDHAIAALASTGDSNQPVNG